ncbi:MAG TPA: hypothetical protein VEB22_03565, partial [Phycisphaerales bacterium]|nr:hypothetical protein [Phycisphaerales bacterium]
PGPARGFLTAGGRTLTVRLGPADTTLASVWINVQPQLGNPPAANALGVIQSMPWLPDTPVLS